MKLDAAVEHYFHIFHGKMNGLLFPIPQILLATIRASFPKTPTILPRATLIISDLAGKSKLTILSCSRMLNPDHIPQTVDSLAAG